MSNAAAITEAREQMERGQLIKVVYCAGVKNLVSYLNYAQ